MKVSNFSYIDHSITASAYFTLLDWRYPSKVSSSQANEKTDLLVPAKQPEKKLELTREEMAEMRLQKFSLLSPSSSSQGNISKANIKPASSESNIVTITEVLARENTKPITALPSAATTQQDPGQSKALTPAPSSVSMPTRDVSLVGKTVVCVFSFAALSVVGLVETIARSFFTFGAFSFWMLNPENEKMRSIFERSMETLLSSVGAAFSSLIAILPSAGTCEQVVTRMVAEGILVYMRPWSPVRI